MFTIKLQRGYKTVEKTVGKPGDKPGDKPSDKPGDKSGEKNKENTREKILEIILINSKVTIPELAKMLNITYKGVQYHLTEMKKEGIVIREGSRKAGYWKIIHENKS